MLPITVPHRRLLDAQYKADISSFSLIHCPQKPAVWAAALQGPTSYCLGSLCAIKCRYQARCAESLSPVSALWLSRIECSEPLLSKGNKIPLLCAAVYFGETCKYFDITLGKLNWNMCRESWEMAVLDELHCLWYQAAITPELNLAVSVSASSNIPGCKKWFPVSLSSGSPTPVPSGACLVCLCMTDVALFLPRFSPWRNSIFLKCHLQCKNRNKRQIMHCKIWVLPQLS